MRHPSEFPSNGDIEFPPGGATNTAFRFVVSHGAKIRARDDIRRTIANLCAPVLTPIALPTWGHLSQVAKNAHHTNTDWDFLRGDRASAYKQLPLDHRYANLTVIALRNHKTGRWMGFATKAILFGVVSEVTHYNCFSRT